MHIAINGWQAADHAAQPARYHVHEVGERLAAEADTRVSVVTPQPLSGHKSDAINWQVALAPASEWGRIQFEQQRLPATAHAIGADVVLHLESSAPIRSPVPNLVRVRTAPAGSSGIVGRLRRSLGVAGAAGASGRFRWQDDPGSRTDPAVILLPPLVGGAFRATESGSDRELCRSLGLPQAYVLAHGLPGRERQRLLAAWTWVEASIGDQIPLVVIGGDPDELRAAAVAVDVGDSTRALPPPPVPALPAVYRSADAFFFPSTHPHGAELRWALACGTPVAAAQSPAAASVVADAGYLAAPDDIRALGAACLTLLVEREELGQRQAQRGLLRARSYHGGQPVRALIEAAANAAAG